MEPRLPHSRAAAAVFVFLVLLGLVRIVSTYRHVSQTSDENPNLACGMEWLDRGRYTYGPFHPPLARIAIAAGPYLSGLRSQGLPDRWHEGIAILNSGKRYGAVLTAARAGVLPFFVLGALCVWLWSRRILGDWAALVPVFLFTTAPPVLAHAGLATTDMAVCAGVLAAVYAFAHWIEEPAAGRSVVLGLAFAAAFLSKFSAVVFVPACAAAILAVYWFARRRLPRHMALLAIAAAVSFFAIWGLYRFSWGTVPGLPVVSRVPVPAPEILQGLLLVKEHNEEGHPAYLLGRNRMEGWWYFFPVALAVKAPLGLLLLAAVGFCSLRRRKDPAHWAPAVSAAAILLVCLPARLNIGVRYVLPIFPMLAITAGMGLADVLSRPRRRLAFTGAAAALLLWAGVSSALAHPDYIPYFNELAGGHPERVLVDSDLDWGQDMKRLSARLKELGVKKVYLACLYSGDYDRLDLPEWDGLEPFRPVSGWVAVSYTMLKTNGWHMARAMGRNEPAFAWLEKYQPVAKAGKSILIYSIPAAEAGSDQ